MKTFYKILILVVLLWNTSYVIADSPGEAYVYEVEVTFDKGKVNGYVWLGSIFHEMVDTILSSDPLFTDFILKYNPEDSLFLFRKVYFVDSLDLHIYFKDQLVKISERKISSIKCKRKIATGFGNWVPTDRFTTQDLSWLKKTYVKKERLWDESCDLDIYFFEQPEKNLVDEIEKLKKNNSSSYSQKLIELLKKLEKQKVVVRSYCSG